MVAILMTSAKFATLELLKIIFFWNSGYGAIISFHEVTNKLLSHESNYVVDMVSDQSFVTLAFPLEKLW